MQNSRIDLIDDDHALLDATASLLRLFGFSVRTWPSAATFLSEAASIESDCMVVDVRMPEMDGFELLRKLRAGGNTVPALMMTGHGGRELEANARELNVTAILEKPCDAGRLVEALGTAIAS